MSRTARTQAERIVSRDNYPTPSWATDLILPILPKYFMRQEVEAGLRVLEPAAGAGAIAKQLRHAKWCVACDMIEVRSEEMARLEGISHWPQWVAPRVTIGDFVASRKITRAGVEFGIDPLYVDPSTYRHDIDIVLTNPPYNAPHKGIGFDFVKRAHQFVKPHGIIVMLLPLSFLESAARYSWLSVNEPDIYILTRRPSFISTGTRPSGTDAMSYGWFVWKRHLAGKRTIGKISHLECPPAEKRRKKADNADQA